MNRQGSPAFTFIEVVILVLILIILALVGIASIQRKPVGMTGTMNNMRQIYLATQQMALEGSTTGDNMLCWPGDLPHPDWITFQKKLVPEYLGEEEFVKLLSAPDFRPPSRFPNPAGQNPYKVFAIREADPGNTIFIVSRNWQGFGQPLTNITPFRQQCFVLIRKGGDAAGFSWKQARSSGATNGGFLGRTNGVVISQ